YSGTGTTQCILNQLACGNLNISNNIIDSVILDGVNGKIVYTTRMNTLEGLNTFVLNEVNTLDAGIYLVTIHAGNESQVFKLIKH
ncbi:MAG: T9SS type A sorting domain-containing protein, partial [Bacteroidota bacterium]